VKTDFNMQFMVEKMVFKVFTSADTQVRRYAVREAVEVTENYKTKHYNTVCVFVTFESPTTFN